MKTEITKNELRIALQKQFQIEVHSSQIQTTKYQNNHLMRIMMIFGTGKGVGIFRYGLVDDELKIYALEAHPLNRS